MIHKHLRLLNIHMLTVQCPFNVVILLSICVKS